jgi:DNA-binding NarL/FixJ family response regulator
MRRHPMTADAARTFDAASPASILVVDDHAIVRHGLVRLLDGEEDLKVCGEAATREDALDALRRLEPDLAVVDLALEGADGLELIKQMRGEGGDVRCLVLSMYDESLYAERALRAGASGYVMKEEATETLVEAIREVLAGEIFVSERIMDGILRKLRRVGPLLQVHTALRIPEDGAVLAPPLHGPLLLVHEAVVTAAQEHAVLEAGLALIRPVLDMMGVGEPQPAAGEPAAAVPHRES